MAGCEDEVRTCACTVDPRAGAATVANVFDASSSTAANGTDASRELRIHVCTTIGTVLSTCHLDLPPLVVARAVEVNVSRTSGRRPDGSVSAPVGDGPWGGVHRISKAE